MSRGTWIYRDGELIEKHLAPPRPIARSGLAAPMVVRDGLPELIGQHDGKTYTSKSALRRSYKEHGLIELGNETPKATPQKLTGQRDDLRRAVAKVKSGYKPKLPKGGDL